MISKVLNLLNSPLSVSSKDVFLLKDELEKHPYFQPLHLLCAKAVADSNHQQFTEVLNKTATYCPNRIILFEYLNTPAQHPIPLPQHDVKEASVPTENTNTTPEDLTTSTPKKSDKDAHVEITEKSVSALDGDINADLHVISSNDSLASPPYEEQQLPSEINPASSDTLNTQKFSVNEKEPTDLSDKVENKTPSETSNESEVISNQLDNRHSFGEWLSLQKPILNPEPKEKVNEKFKIIEEFLEKNPKITPAKIYKPTIEVNPNPKENLSHLMTETLAKIYVEQNKYDKAIKAYTILRLKYPEKSGYFADRIKEIKTLKNN